MTEATPIGEEIQHGTPDDTAEERQEEGEDSIPHCVEDMQEMLQARNEAPPVQPVRKNPVRRVKMEGRRMNGVLIGSKRNNVKKSV